MSCHTSKNNEEKKQILLRTIHLQRDRWVGSSHRKNLLERAENQGEQFPRSRLMQILTRYVMDSPIFLKLFGQLLISKKMRDNFSWFRLLPILKAIFVGTFLHSVPLKIKENKDAPLGS